MINQTVPVDARKYLLARNRLNLVDAKDINDVFDQVESTIEGLKAQLEESKRDAAHWEHEAKQFRTQMVEVQVQLAESKRALADAEGKLDHADKLLGEVEMFFTEPPDDDGTDLWRRISDFRGDKQTVPDTYQLKECVSVPKRCVGGVCDRCRMHLSEKTFIEKTNTLMNEAHDQMLGITRAEKECKFALSPSEITWYCVPGCTKHNQQVNTGTVSEPEKVPIGFLRCIGKTCDHPVEWHRNEVGGCLECGCLKFEDPRQDAGEGNADGRQ